MKVRIASVNVPARQLSLVPVEPRGEAREPPRPKKRTRKARIERKPTKKRRK